MRDRKDQRRCRDCIREKPKHSVEAHARSKQAKG